MIYTIDYIESEANLIASHGNDRGEKFIDSAGYLRTEQDVNFATLLLEKIEEIKLLTKVLSI